MVQIAEQEYRLVSVDEIQPHPDNPNLGDDGAVLESLDENGFYGAVILQRSTMRLIAGHTRWRTARESGLKELPAFLLDVDDDRALRMMLADNRTAELASRDQQVLARVLTRLKETPQGSHGTAYSEQDADFIRQQAGLFAQEASGFLDGADDEDEYEDDDEDAPEPSGETEATWFTLSYTVTREQRTIVQDAIKAARSSDSELTSAEALVVICDRFNKRSE